MTNNVFPLITEADPNSEIEIQFQLINKRLELVDLRLTRIEQLAADIKQIVTNGRTYEQD